MQLDNAGKNDRSVTVLPLSLANLMQLVGGYANIYQVNWSYQFNDRR